MSNLNITNPIRPKCLSSLSTLKNVKNTNSTLILFGINKIITPLKSCNAKLNSKSKLVFLPNKFKNISESASTTETGNTHENLSKKIITQIIWSILQSLLPYWSTIMGYRNCRVSTMSDKNKFLFYWKKCKLCWRSSQKTFSACLYNKKSI